MTPLPSNVQTTPPISHDATVNHVMSLRLWPPTTLISNNATAMPYINANISQRHFLPITPISDDAGVDSAFGAGVNLFGTFSARGRRPR